LGLLARNLGQPDEARRYYEQALAIAREVGNRGSEGSTLNSLGLLARNLGQPDEARRYFEQAVGILHEVGNRSGEATALYNLGSLARYLGQPVEARRYYEQALTLFEALGATDNAQRTRDRLLALDAGAPVLSSIKAMDTASPGRRRWWWPFGR
jgi:tetratricopeptide (TPR) repeat protein